MVAVDMPPGRGACGCRGCGEVFTCVSAFDKHQTLDETGNVCHDPEAIGLELHERPDKTDPDNPWLLWGWPSGGQTDWYDHLEE